VFAAGASIAEGSQASYVIDWAANAGVETSMAALRMAGNRCVLFMMLSLKFIQCGKMSVTVDSDRSTGQKLTGMR
jgi:hypothetical protein